MSESTPHFAPIVVLLFLGSVVLAGISLLVLLYGAISRSKPVIRVAGAALAIVMGGYLFLLGGTSLMSREKTLPPGGAKYFCELDCHIAYSVGEVRETSSLGPELQPAFARGKFVIVKLRSWFDENSISPRRGDGPLTPNRRGIVLIDDAGNHYLESAAGEKAMNRMGEVSTPLNTPLRPGQSYTTSIVFEVPKSAGNLRLLLTEDDPETVLIIGHENSLLHKKVYFGLDAVSNLTGSLP